jgi:hypothetical protein
LNGNSLLGSGDIAISTNPKLLGFSGKIGTQTSGTAVTSITLTFGGTVTGQIVTAQLFGLN